MVAVMILHIRSKYTAVGRKEIVTFFYMYFVVELLSIFLDSGIIPSSSNVYAVSFQRSASRVSRAQSLHPAVVRRDPPRTHLRHLLVPPRQRLCGIPICRRRNTSFPLGMRLA